MAASLELADAFEPQSAVRSVVLCYNSNSRRRLDRGHWSGHLPDQTAPPRPAGRWIVPFCLTLILRGLLRPRARDYPVGHGREEDSCKNQAQRQKRVEGSCFDEFASLSARADCVPVLPVIFWYFLWHFYMRVPIPEEMSGNQKEYFHIY